MKSDIPSSTEPQVGEKRKTLRARKELSLRELSDQSGLSFNAISKIERGENPPTVVPLHKIAAVLEVHIPDLFRNEIQRFAVFVKSENSTLLKSVRKTKKQHIWEENTYRSLYIVGPAGFEPATNRL